MEHRTMKRRATAEDAGRDSAPDAAAVLDYVGDMCRELAEMARRGGHTKLAGLLDLAHNEAHHGGNKH
jgi:hypothetical protein